VSTHRQMAKSAKSPPITSSTSQQVDFRKGQVARLSSWQEEIAQRAGIDGIRKKKIIASHACEELL